ncbi:hypothetical protein GCM10009741_07280 [Kribbella lupini]|uniref:Uncharacterized protein n=1 Tax=Kribbella lupini TaxID=291602 RepID=A0ABN2A6Q3_9ACTN
MFGPGITTSPSSINAIPTSASVLTTIKFPSHGNNPTEPNSHPEPHRGIFSHVRRADPHAPQPPRTTRLDSTHPDGVHRPRPLIAPARQHPPDNAGSS